MAPRLLEDIEETVRAHSREGLCQHWAIRQDAPPFHSPLHLARVCRGDRRKVASVEGNQSRFGGETEVQQPRFFGVKGSSRWALRSSFFLAGVDESDALFNFGDIEIIVVKRENILTLNLRNLFNECVRHRRSTFEGLIVI